MDDWLKLSVDAALGLAGVVNVFLLSRAQRATRTEIAITVRTRASRRGSPSCTRGAGRGPAKG